MVNEEKTTPKTIAIINFKGGVGKTTMTWCLGDYLSTYKDNNALIFDLDAQMSLTQAIALNEDASSDRQFAKWENYSRQNEKTIFNAFLNYSNDCGFDIDYNFIYQISDQYHFIPCDERFYIVDYIELKDFDRKNIREGMQGFMKDLLKKITLSKNVIRYDYALFDCPPSFTILSYSVLSCCDLILVPVNPDFYAVRGVNILLRILRIIKENKAQAFSMPKVAVFMNKAKKSSKGVMEKVGKNYWDNIVSICGRTSSEKNMNIRCFNARIYERADIKKAVTGKRGIPTEFVPDFQDLWNDIVRFINE